MGLKRADEIRTVREAVNQVYSTYVRAKDHVVGCYDRDVRHPEWTRRLLDTLEAPDQYGYNVAVTGSKGKGSHSILLACILERLGYRVGLFTGPHLVDFMERFRVDGKIIAEPMFLSYARRVLQIVSSFDFPQEQYCGPVGILAAVAALWFHDEQTEVNVYECGRGALHDDVNQIMHQGAVLTPVFMEHARQLGPSLADIGREKAGVVTADTTWLVSHEQPPTVTDAVKRRLHSRAEGAPYDWLTLDHDFTFSVEHWKQDVRITLHAGLRSMASVRIPSDYVEFGPNVAVALRAAMRIVDATGGTKRVSNAVPAHLEIDLRDLQLPGRLHVVRKAPLTVIDGTIHASSAAMIVRWLKRECTLANRDVRVGAILGLPTDKDGLGVLQQLAPILNWCIISKAHNPHLTFDDEWYQTAVSMGMDVEMAEGIDEASQMADGRLQRSDVLLVLGTQSFVGDSLVHFGADSRSIWR